MCSLELALQEQLARTGDEVFSRNDWQQLLASGSPLRIKYGVDVTAPYLHIGHAVNLWLMRQLQEMGHTIVFLVGDFTTRIGDPTGRDLLRPVLSAGEIAQNAEMITEQAKMVLRFDDPRLLEIRRNSEWYNQTSAEELLRLFSMITHSRLIARDMFQRRIQQGQDIHIHEMLYPVLQGYDSLMIHADLTIIGSDQLFNETLGRFYQERHGQKPQVIITTRITPGIDGKAKQSKSLDNYIGLGHTPREKFGRTMKIPDELIYTYLEVYTDLPMATIAALQADADGNPMQAKLLLAEEIVRRYHGPEQAHAEREWFRQTFSARTIPGDIPHMLLIEDQLSAFEVVKRFFGTERSNAEIRRLFQQGAVACNGRRITQSVEQVPTQTGDEWQVGKRHWFRIAH